MAWDVCWLLTPFQEWVAAWSVGRGYGAMTRFAPTPEKFEMTSLLTKLFWDERSG